ncbi:ER membrane protein complex subunit 10 [[Candida] zeylanoides]
MLVALLYLISLALAQTVKVYACLPYTSDKLEIGSIVVDDNGPSMFGERSSAIDDNVHYCIGTNDLSNHGCFAYTGNTKNAKFVVQTSDTEIVRLQLNPDPAAPSVVRVNGGAPAGPTPIMRPVHKRKHTSKQPTRKRIRPRKQSAEKAKEDEDVAEEEAEEEEEVDDRSWVQKNWMYIVPGLLILFVGLGSDEQK